MFEALLDKTKASLVTKNGHIKKAEKPNLPTGNRIWEIAARSNAKPVVIIIKRVKQ